MKEQTKINNETENIDLPQIFAQAMKKSAKQCLQQIPEQIKRPYITKDTWKLV